MQDLNRDGLADDVFYPDPGEGGLPNPLSCALNVGTPLRSCPTCPMTAWKTVSCADYPIRAPNGDIDGDGLRDSANFFAADDDCPPAGPPLRTKLGIQFSVGDGMAFKSARHRRVRDSR